MLIYLFKNVIHNADNDVYIVQQPYMCKGWSQGVFWPPVFENWRPPPCWKIRPDLTGHLRPNRKKFGPKAQIIKNYLCTYTPHLRHLVQGTILCFHSDPYVKSRVVHLQKNPVSFKRDIVGSVDSRHILRIILQAGYIVLIVTLQSI